MGSLPQFFLDNSNWLVPAVTIVGGILAGLLTILKIIGWFSRGKSSKKTNKNNTSQRKGNDMETEINPGGLTQNEILEISEGMIEKHILEDDANYAMMSLNVNPSYVEKGGNRLSYFKNVITYLEKKEKTRQFFEKLVSRGCRYAEVVLRQYF